MTSSAQRGAPRNAHAGNGGSSGSSIAEVSRETRRLRAQLSEISHTAGEIANGCRALLGERLRQQPYVVLATAAGVGYVLGGGLPRGLMRGLLTVGGRLMLETVVAHGVGGVAQRRSVQR